MTDQLSPEPQTNPGSHEQFVELFDEFLGAVYPPSGGNRTDTGRRKFARSLARELRQRSAKRVLDCAAGTGFPSLDIEREAPGQFEIHCCDGDAMMVAMLATRAKEREIDLESMMPARSVARPLAGQLGPLVVNWADLDELHDRYDYVLCRGNALAYANTWTGNKEVASEETVHDYLERMIRLVRPGGYLHVDAPKTARLKRTIGRTLGTIARSIEEEVTVESGRRRWTVTFRHDGEEPVSFTRFSSLLTIDHIQSILDDLGLDQTEPFQLADERPNFGVIIARKPA